MRRDEAKREGGIGRAKREEQRGRVICGDTSRV